MQQSDWMLDAQVILVAILDVAESIFSSNCHTFLQVDRFPHLPGKMSSDRERIPMNRDRLGICHPSAEASFLGPPPGHISHSKTATFGASESTVSVSGMVLSRWVVYSIKPFLLIQVLFSQVS